MTSHASSRAAALLAAVIGMGSAVTSQQLILSNSLDDRNAVENSVVGPGLRFATEVDADHGFVTPGFVPAMYRSGLTAIDSPLLPSPQHRHNAFLDDVGAVLSADRGTIEVWLRIDRMPTPQVQGPYRIFSGPGEFGASNIRLYVATADLGGDPMLRFAMLPIFDPDLGGVPLEIVVDHPVGGYLGEWLLIDALWDRAGIDGSGETMRLYVNRRMVGATRDANWGPSLGEIADIGGGDGSMIEAFVLDELKIWDAAVTPPPPAAFESFGAGCKGAAGAPELAADGNSMPDLGTTFTMTIASLPSPRWCVGFGLIGASKDFTGGYPLPIDLGLIGMPNCWLRISPDADVLLDNNCGDASWSLPIPADANLGGSHFYVQMLVLDASANVFGATMSNACEGTFGFPR